MNFCATPPHQPSGRCWRCPSQHVIHSARPSPSSPTCECRSRAPVTAKKNRQNKDTQQDSLPPWHTHESKLFGCSNKTGLLKIRQCSSETTHGPDGALLVPEVRNEVTQRELEWAHVAPLRPPRLWQYYPLRQSCFLKVDTARFAKSLPASSQNTKDPRRRLMSRMTCSALSCTSPRTPVTARLKASISKFLFKRWIGKRSPCKRRWYSFTMTVTLTAYFAGPPLTRQTFT